MFLRHKLRRKAGKEHRYWSIVENRRVSSGRMELTRFAEAKQLTAALQAEMVSTQVK